MRAITEHLGHKARAAAIAAVVCLLATALLLVLGSGPASSAPERDGEQVGDRHDQGLQVQARHDQHFARATASSGSNRDGAAHTATRGGSFDTGKIKPGKAVAVKFSSKGTYRYICSLHPEMTGKVIVGG